MKKETIERALDILFAAFVFVMCSSLGAIVASGAYAVAREVFLVGCG